MITINLNKAKDIAHLKRRQARSAEFAPLDIKATIPMEAASAEAERANIRTKYNDIQINIDNAETIDSLKQIVEAL